MVSLLQTIGLRRAAEEAAASFPALMARAERAVAGLHGDHTQRKDHTIDWRGDTVYHFVVDWTPGGYTVSVDGNVWFQGSFNGAFAPPNHRISLGCYPRGETMKGAYWRNVSITPH